MHMAMMINRLNAADPTIVPGPRSPVIILLSLFIYYIMGGQKKTE